MVLRNLKREVLRKVSGKLPVATLSERKERTQLGLSRYAAEAAEQAAVHRDKLSISGKVKDVADVHETLWPEQTETKPFSTSAFLQGLFRFVG